MVINEPISRATATLIGFVAVVLWASLATLTVLSGQVPPFELTAITFAIGGSLGLLVAASRGRSRMVWHSWPVLCLGVGGLFGDYTLYFAALRLAPASQAALIVALWPLMMIALAAIALRDALKPRHALGAVVGLAGVLVLTVDSQNLLSFDAHHLQGYVLALGAAVVWAVYSVASRRLAEVPTEAVTSFCLVTAVLAALCHLGWERTVLPSDPRQMLAIAGLGAGPVGMSFFAWDIGVKHGDIRVLGVLANATPLLSTLSLMVNRLAAPTPRLGIACVLVILAAMVGTTKPYTPSRRPWARILRPRRRAHGTF